jgi:low temperature requirement protein LtrA
VVILAVAQKAAVAGPGAPLPAAARLALSGGVALFVAGHAAFRRRLGGRVAVADGAAVAALGLLALISADLAAWALCGLVAAVTAGLAAATTLRGPDREAGDSEDA